MWNVFELKLFYDCNRVPGTLWLINGREIKQMLGKSSRYFKDDWHKTGKYISPLLLCVWSRACACQEKGVICIH